MGTSSVDEYLDALPQDARDALAKLRRAIRAAAPMASEVISMGVPTYRHQGTLVSFSAAKHHCAFYVMSEAAMHAHKADLTNHDTAKTAIRFPAGAPLADALVKKLVRTRIRENQAKGGK